MDKNYDNRSIMSKDSDFSFNMKLDFNESILNVDKLKRSSNCQNYINLLNNPNPEYSFIEDITSRLNFEYLYSYTQVVEEDGDLSKFGGILGSPISQGSTKSGSLKGGETKQKAPPKKIKEPPKKIKELVSESYYDYLKMLGRKYKKYIKNHFTNEGSNSLVQINPYDNSYVAIDFHKTIYKVVSEEYFTSNYKIKNYILNKSFDELLDFSEELTEKCCVVESHLSKVMEKSQMLFNYINKNICLEQKFGEYIDKIAYLKRVRQFMKKNFLNNAALTIKAGLKKKNIQKTISFVKELDFVYKSAKLIKTLINVPSKFQTVLELQEKSNKILLNLSSRKSKVAIVKNIEDEFKEYSKKITENTNKQVGYTMQEALKKIINISVIDSSEVDENIQQEEINYYTEHYNINIAEIQTKITLPILRAIKISDEFALKNMHKQIIEAAMIVFKIDTEFYTKLRNIFRVNFIQVMSDTQEKIINLFCSSLDVKKTDMANFLKNLNIKKDQQLYILILTKCFHDIYNNLKNLGGEILSAYKDFIYGSNFNLNKKKADILSQTFSDEVQEINKVLLSELFEIIKSQNQKLIKRQDNTEYNYTTINIIKNFFPNETIFNGIFKKNQDGYINQLFENKDKRIKQSLEFETWESVSVPEKFKRIVDLIIEIDFNSVKSKKINQVLEEFNSLEEYEENNTTSACLSPVLKLKKNNISGFNSNNLKLDKIEKEQEKTNQKEGVEDNKKAQNDYLLAINDSQYKLIISMFEVIMLIFKSYKMLCLFDNVLYESVLNKLSKVIRNACSMSNDMIINQKAVANKIISSVTNEEVTHMVSSFSFIRRLLQSIIKNIPNVLKKESVDLVSNYLQEAISDINTLVLNGKHFLFKIAYEFSIKESLTILAKIDFRNYPIIDDGVNLYAKKLKPIVSVYDKMANCFEINDLTETMTLILNSIVENITKQIGNTKIENDNQLKQFKKDMKFIKNKLKSITKVDTTEYINKLEAIVKGITSVKISFNKKNIDD